MRTDYINGSDVLVTVKVTYKRKRYWFIMKSGLTKRLHNKNKD
jgi:hypothetical protein